MRRTKRTKKKVGNVPKTDISVETAYSPQFPPPPSVPTAEEEGEGGETVLSGSPITISSQKDLDILVNKVKKNDSPPSFSVSSPISTPPVEKVVKKNFVKRNQQDHHQNTKAKKKKKSDDEKDEDYVETGGGSEDEEDSDFDDNVESSEGGEEMREIDDENDDGGEKRKRYKSDGIRKTTKAVSKLPQAVRNRIAAQEFRQRQKTYIFELEQKVDNLTRMNANVNCRLKILVRENSVLRYHLSFLRDFIAKVSPPLPPQNQIKTVIENK